MFEFELSSAGARVLGLEQKGGLRECLGNESEGGGLVLKRGGWVVGQIDLVNEFVSKGSLKQWFAAIVLPGEEGVWGWVAGKRFEQFCDFGAPSPRAEAS